MVPSTVLPRYLPNTYTHLPTCYSSVGVWHSSAFQHSTNVTHPGAGAAPHIRTRLRVGLARLPCTTDQIHRHIHRWHQFRMRLSFMKRSSHTHCMHRTIARSRPPLKILGIIKQYPHRQTLHDSFCKLAPNPREQQPEPTSPPPSGQHIIW